MTRIRGARERTVTANGIDLHVLEAGDEGRPAVVLAHGFPELAFSWRHQIPVLADAGYHVIAPDQRGYGGSTRPEAIEDYDILHLTGDLVGLLDAIGIERAVFVGHDWGSMVSWHMPLLAPERVSGVVGMSVPFVPRPPMRPLELMRAAFGDSFFYIIYFQEPGVADADLSSDTAKTMRRMLAGLTMEDLSGDLAARVRALGADDGRGFVDRLPEPAQLPDWLTQDELDHYVSEFSRTGFTGGINWYRNFDRNWEETGQLEGVKVHVPSLFVAGSADPVLLMSPPTIQEGWLEDHRGDVIIEGAGHWVQQEAPAPVNTALLEFLGQMQSEGRGW